MNLKGFFLKSSNWPKLIHEHIPVKSLPGTVPNLEGVLKLQKVHSVAED